MISGAVPACKLIILAAKRHLRDLQNGKKRGLYFDPIAGQHIIDFFGFLRHSKGEWGGQAFTLEPWQQFIVWVLFGWKRADGLRRFRTAYVEIPRKNGKSTLLAGIGLYLLFADGEPGAEVYAAATKKDQARIIHGEAVRMRNASPLLAKHIAKFRDNLSVTISSSKFEPLGADEDTLDGLNIHAALVDELHAHKTRGLWDVLDTATGARRQPLMFAITTAGFNKQSVCWEQHDYTEKVLSGIFDDDTFFGYIACLDEGDDWEDERTWAKANPNFGVSVKIDDLRRKAAKAKNQPTALNSFLRLHLNVWTQQEIRFLPLDKWDACAGEVDAADLYGRECVGALDLASKIDIAAVLLLFTPTEDDAIYRVLPFFFIPDAAIEQRAKRDRVPYDVWVREGLIEATDGNVTDYDFIRQRVCELKDDYGIREIAFDPWNATQIATQLQGDGVTMVEFGQGFRSMSEPTKELERIVISGELAHGGNPVLRWMAGNVAVKQDPAGNLKPDKDKSTEKIDGIVALIMALGRAIVQPEEHGSNYEKRGVLLL